jgi:SAM-dependent methyltransferase
MMQSIRRYLRPRRLLAKISSELAVRLGLLRRVRPIGRSFGIERGGPIDRYYIDAFIARHRHDIRGVVLEAGGFTSYTERFGEDRVTRGEVLYPKPGFPDGTLVGDLVTGEGIPSDAFDCLILTQVFPFIYDLPAAVMTCHRALKPDGVLLATLPGISQIVGYDRENWGDFWRFTDGAVTRLFGDAFGPANVTVETHGNVFVACAFLHGLSAKDLTSAELSYHDPAFQLSITARAVKKTATDAG